MSEKLSFVELVDRAIERSCQNGSVQQEEYDAWQSLKTETVPLSVVEDVLEGCAVHTDFFINGSWEAVLKEIKQKAGL